MKKAGDAAVAGAAIGALAISILLGAEVVGFFAAWKSVWLALSALCLLVCLSLLLMALRKFGNDEVPAGSRIVQKANAFGSAGFLFLAAAMAVALGGFEGTAFFAAALAVFAWLWRFGKKNMKYW